MNRLGLAAFLLLLITCAPRQRDEGRAAARLIPMAPSITEFVYALGLGERVVGIGGFTVWPPEALAKPRLGGLHDPNLEAMVALRPDLVIMLPSQQGLADQLARLGIESLVVRSESLADAEETMVRIAERCGVPAAGRALVARFRAGLAPRRLPGSPRVMLALDRQAGRLANVVTPGGGTFYDELLARLGAKNVFADAIGVYPQVGAEEILRRRPEVICEIQSRPLSAGAMRALRRDWRQLGGTALGASRIEIVDADYTVIPGPRLPLLYDRLAAALEPRR